MPHFIKSMMFICSITVLFNACSSSGSGSATPEDATANIEDNAENVSINSSFSVTFIRNVDTDTVDSSSFFITSTTETNALVDSLDAATSQTQTCDPENAITATISCSRTTECTLTPEENLAYSTTYTLCLTADILFENINFGSLEPISIQFTTESNSTTDDDSDSNDEDNLTYTVGGTITGLNGTLVIQNNDGDNLTITENGTFTFSTSLADNASYAVTVLTQPDDEICSISQSSGTIAGDDIDSISITCAENTDNDPTIVTINVSSGPAFGGTGFTLTGTNMTGTTSVTFGGTQATNLVVESSASVTGITPSNSAGNVDIVITTGNGSGTLSAGYTYVANAIGQSSSGGIMGCLTADGDSFDLITTFSDISSSIEWGGLGTIIGATAQSATDGATNTAAIVSDLGANGGSPYAADACDDFEIDSQGNTPCESGYTCYQDWYLPANNQLSCLYDNRVSIGGFAASTYWSSSENTSSPSTNADGFNFSIGSSFSFGKNTNLRARCVRSISP